MRGKRLVIRSQLMINLLPPKNKQELLGEESYKVIIILGISALAILACLSLILYAINIFISGEIDYQKTIYEQKEKELTSPKMLTLEKNLKSFNETFLRLDYFYRDKFKAVKALEEISKAVPEGIYLTNLSVNAASGEEGEERAATCILSGFSPDRETLLEFKENLEKEENNFEEIYFPPATWVKPVDINFVVNFKISQQ